MRTIKLYVCTSEGELREELLELARFVDGLNNRYVDRDVYIELNDPRETSETDVGAADAAVFMFFHKAGQVTLHELEAAHRALVERGLPSVFVYFKAVGNAPDVAAEIQECVNRVANDYGHYFKLFDSADTVKLELLQYLVDEIPGGLELKVEDGRVMVGKEAVQGINLDHVFAYQNNPELMRLKGRIEELSDRMYAAEGLSAKMAVSRELSRASEEYAALESDILSMLKTFYEEGRRGRRADPRRMEALRLLELGNAREAKDLISQEEIRSRADALARRQALQELANRNEASEIVDDALVRIQALKMDVTDPGRFDQISVTYRTIRKAAETARNYDALFGEVGFLHDQNRFSEAVEACERLRRLLHTSGDAVPQKELARVGRELAGLYSATGRLSEAEPLCKEALRTYRTLAEVEPGAYVPDVARVCNNLASLYWATGRLSEAEPLYGEALGTYRTLAEVEPGAYVPDVAKVCNNLANLYSHTGRLSEAEPLYREALGTYRMLAEEDSGAYGPFTAIVSFNLGVLYEKSEQHRPEAEALYREALELAKRQPDNRICAQVIEQLSHPS